MPHVVITGASRGLGRELACRYATSGWSVTAAVRDPARVELPGQIDVRRLDVNQPRSFAMFAAGIERPIDVLINNAGVFGPRPQKIADIDPETWVAILTANTIGPVLLTRALVGHVAAGTHKKLVTITSRMGSLGENSSGSAPMYRSSKAAVNMAMQCLSFEVATRGLGVLLVHPGWVRTAMGTAEADLDVGESAAGVRAVIDAFDPSERLGFRAWDGRDIAW